MKKATKIYTLGLVFGIFNVLLIWNVNLEAQYRKRIFSSLEDVPYSYAVIVPGASVRPNQAPSEALKERLDSAIKLYQNKKA